MAISALSSFGISVLDEEKNKDAESVVDNRRVAIPKKRLKKAHDQEGDTLDQGDAESTQQSDEAITNWQDCDDPTKGWTVVQNKKKPNPLEEQQFPDFICPSAW